MPRRPTTGSRVRSVLQCFLWLTCGYSCGDSSPPPSTAGLGAKTDSGAGAIPVSTAAASSGASASSPSAARTAPGPVAVNVEGRREPTAGVGGSPPATMASVSAGSSAAAGAAALPAFEGQGDPWTQSAPRATCRSGDMPEKGLQGNDGDIRCNLVVHGQAKAPHFLSHAWYKNCAYVNGQTGTTVIDVSDSAHPVVTTTLTTTGMQSNWETMKVNERSGLLAGYQSNGPVLDIYDVSKDCTHPELQKSLDLGGSGHAGQFSTDGTIYYASSLTTGEVFAVDLANPRDPKVITSDFAGKGAHDLFIGKEGTRGYFGYSDLLGGIGMGMVAIIDTSEIQARASGAKGRVISEWSWKDGNITQYPILISYRGKDHLLITDELGSGSCDDPEKPPYGYARIFDISDEKNPVLVSKIKTEAVGPCMGTPVGDGFFGVGTHYCNVDRTDDPRLLACGFWSGGVRVFDIRNPWRPLELAYFDTAEANVPGLVRIKPEERELWVATIPETFYVLRFADGVLDPILQDQVH